MGVGGGLAFITWTFESEVNFLRKGKLGSGGKQLNNFDSLTNLELSERQKIRPLSFWNVIWKCPILQFEPDAR